MSAEWVRTDQYDVSCGSLLIDGAVPTAHISRYEIGFGLEDDEVQHDFSIKAGDFSRVVETFSFHDYPPLVEVIKSAVKEHDLFSPNTEPLLEGVNSGTIREEVEGIAFCKILGVLVGRKQTRTSGIYPDGECFTQHSSPGGVRSVGRFGLKKALGLKEGSPRNL